MIRLVLVDDHPDLVALLRAGLGPNFEVVGDAPDGRSGVEVVRAERPDVVVMDLSMPDMDGLEAIRRLRLGGPQRVVVFSGFQSEALEEASLRHGASAYVEKGTPLARLRDVLRSAVTSPVPPVTDPASLTKQRVQDLI